MKTLLKVGVGFLAGYAWALLSALLASKRLGDAFRRNPPHPAGTCAEDCPWRDGHQHQDLWQTVEAELNGDDMHDVLPTDDDRPTMADFVRAHEQPTVDKAMKWQQYWGDAWSEVLRKAVAIEWPDPPKSPGPAETLHVAGFQPDPRRQDTTNYCLTAQCQHCRHVLNWHMSGRSSGGCWSAGCECPGFYGPPLTDAEAHD